MSLNKVAVLLSCAGLASGASAQSGIEPRGGLLDLTPVPIANIVIDMATGERTAIPFDARPRSGVDPIWLNNQTSDDCPGLFRIIDDPDVDGDGVSDVSGTVCDGAAVPCEGGWYNFWGDIRFDSVVHQVVVSYWITAPDTDLDGDSIGDGIEGYDMSLTFSDSDNGFDDSRRACIIDLTLEDIPGAVGVLPPGFAAVYILTLDFKNLAPSLAFELGDSDGIDDAGTGNSGGAIYGSPTGMDFDSDGLADFSYAIRFDQSGAVSRGSNGVFAVDTFLPDGPFPQAFGIFSDPDIYESGPSCPPNTTPYTPPFGIGQQCGSMQIELYGSTLGAGCPADLSEPFGTLDFSDVIAFLGALGAMEASADLAAPFGVFDFSDVVEFLTLFGGGCEG
ncbi:MAG: GC-type dockerin domain-anchored protein [Phycisphaerales bacterium JB059]